MEKLKTMRAKTQEAIELKDQFGQLKQQFEEKKLQIDRAVGDILNLQMQIIEMKQVLC